MKLKDSNEKVTSEYPTFTVGEILPDSFGNEL